MDSTSGARSDEAPPHFRKQMPHLQIQAVGPNGSYVANTVPSPIQSATRPVSLEGIQSLHTPPPKLFTIPETERKPVRTVVPARFYETTKCTVINPRSKVIQAWDVLLCVALILTATVTPYEAAFIPVDTSRGIPSPFLFTMNRVLDLYFLADFVLSFFIVAQVDLSSFVSPKLTDNTRKYARTWLSVDLISSIPFDFIVFCLINYGGILSVEDNRVVAFTVSPEVLNFLRAVRLLKLLRLFRVTKIFKRLRDTYGMNYRITALAMSFSVLFWCCHLFACGWKLLSDMSTEGTLDTWLFEVDLYDSSHFEQYTTSFYWGMMTLTTTGYGNIPPGNNIERGCACLAMLFGAFLFTRLISRVNASGTSEATSRYRSHRDHLNDLLKLAGCGQQQAIKIRRFFRLSFCKIQHERNAAVLSQMSQRQKGTFVQSLYCTALSTLSFFKEPPPAAGPIVLDRHVLFINAISEKLVARVYPAFEQLVCHGERTTQPTCHMYIIRRGLLGSAGRVYRVNNILGEDIICRDFERFYSINALTFVSTLTLSSRDLHEILRSESFVYQRARIRRASIIIAVKARLHALSRMVRILHSVARVAGVRAIVNLHDLFDSETGQVIVSKERLMDRFHVEQRPLPDGGEESVFCIKPKYARETAQVDERQPSDVSLQELVDEVRELDIENLAPEDAKKKLHFFQRVRTHLLFAEKKAMMRRLSHGSSSDERTRSSDEEVVALEDFGSPR